ncbi:MAG: hypothetical protein AAGA03_19185, partial [Planctomycetota bacterium]
PENKMALPPWSVELLRRGLTDVARRASEPETLNKLKAQATELLQDLPETAARGIDRVMKTAEAGKEAIQTWTRRHTSLVIPTINASGTLLHPGGSGLPIADPVWQVGQEALRGDFLHSGEAASRMDDMMLRSLPGSATAVAVAGSMVSATSALTLLASTRDLVVHRHHAIRVDDTTPLPDLFGGPLSVVKEVGAADEVRESDFDALGPHCIICCDSASDPVQLMPSRPDRWQVVMLPYATCHQHEGIDLPSAESMLAAGADAVILPGGGISGAPECGLIVGRSELLRPITESISWASLEATLVTKLMVAKWLDCSRNHPEQLPLVDLMGISEDNLRGRAERMATRLSAVDGISSTQLTDQQAHIHDNGRWSVPSRQVVLKHESKTAAGWQQELASSTPAVIASTQEDTLSIDLRWVTPDADSTIAEAFE